MKVTSTLNAWKEAQKHISNYEKDQEASKNAGYDIYKGKNGYICDLETRLEVNLDNGESFNIWIEEESQNQNAAKAEKHINVNITTEEISDRKMEKIKFSVSLKTIEKELLKMERHLRCINQMESGDAFVKVEELCDAVAALNALEKQMLSFKLEI